MVKTAPVEKKTRTFRLSWLRLYAVMAAWIIPVLLFLHILSAASHAARSAALAFLLGDLVFMLVFAVAIANIFPNKVSAEKLCGFNGWGGRCDMTWDEIASATPVNTLGLPWLIVRSNAGKNANWLRWNVMWLPLFFADKQGFWEAVAQFAPPSCPLLHSGSPSK